MTGFVPKAAMTWAFFQWPETTNKKNTPELFGKQLEARTLASASEVREPKFWPTLGPDHLQPKRLAETMDDVRPAPSPHCLDSPWSWRAGTLQTYQRLMVKMMQMPQWQPPQCQPPSPIQFQRPQAPLIPIQPPSLPQLLHDFMLSSSESHLVRCQHSVCQGLLSYEGQTWGWVVSTFFTIWHLR